MNAPGDMEDLKESASAGRRYRGVSNEDRRALRHQKLVSAGLDCFAGLGFHQVTVRGVCAAAGLTERYFYESFPGMEDLFRAVYLAASADVRSRIMHAIAAESPDDLERFSRAAMRAFFDSIREQPAYVPVLFQEALSINREVTRLALDTLKEFVDLLMTIGQPSFLKQRRVRVEPGLLSSALVGGIMHMAVRWAEDAFSTPVDDVVDNAMLIFAGLLKPAT